MKKIIIPLLLIGIGIGFGIYEYNRKPASTHKLKADISINSSTLVHDYKDDEPVADIKYLNKIVQITGTISSISSENELTTISLKSDDPLSGVLCEMEGSQNAISFSEGDKIMLKGRCTGYLMDVVLVNCIVIK